MHSKKLIYQNAQPIILEIQFKFDNNETEFVFKSDLELPKEKYI